MAGPIKYQVLKEFIFEPGQEKNIESEINIFLASDLPANVIEAKISIDERFTIITFFVSDVKIQPPAEQLIYNKTFILKTGQERYLEQLVTEFLSADISPKYRSATGAASWHEERFLIYTLFYNEDFILIP